MCTFADQLHTMIMGMKGKHRYIRGEEGGGTSGWHGCEGVIEMQCIQNVVNYELFLHAVSCRYGL